VLLHQGEVDFKGNAVSAVSAYSQRLQVTRYEFQSCMAHLANSSLIPTKCYVEDTTSRAVHSIRYSEPVKILLEYEVTTPLRGVQIAVEVWSQENGCILCSTNLDVSNGDFAVLDVGQYCASCVVPQLLRPGQYWIEVSASIPGMQMLFESTTAWDFEVIDDGSPLALLSQGRRGATLPVMLWQQRRV